MCLAVPGQVVDVQGEQPECRHGIVDFSGIRREVSFCFTPDVRPGEYVVVHVGFALNVVAEEEARRTLETLRELGEAVDEAPG